MFNVIGEWETVGTINASDLSTNAQLIEINMPFTAIGITTRLRLSSTTTGAFMIDNIYVGVDELVAGCNEADLAEPFGALNFFDISAFLSAFSDNDPSADITGDGTFNFFDISAYLSVFSAGCP